MTAAPRATEIPPSPGVPSLSLGIEHLSKRFGRVHANDDITFDVAAGAIHAIVGENGAGKTTLMRVVYGLYPPDSGHVALDGVPVEFRNPRDALTRGVGMVHQHSLLVDSLTVAENVMLALPGLGLPPRREMLTRLRDLSEGSGLQLDPDTPAGRLSVGARQRAEILGALYHGARLLILDEPTTVLTPQEVEQLFAVLSRLNDSGTTILIVTHKLVEVMAVSDAVTVLRGGRHVGTVATADIDEPSLIKMMVGRDVPARARGGAVTATARSSDSEPPLLALSDVRVKDAVGIERVRGVSFEVRAGEIVAVTGVEGNGQSELADAILGTRSLAGGRLLIGGADASSWSVARRRREGLACVPERRMTEGASAESSVADNLILGRHARSPFARLGLRNLRATKRFAAGLIERFGIVAPSVDSTASTLSGGNLQKLVVAREISKEPTVMLVSQPTQGVDVAAAHMIRSSLLELRSEGAGVILVSSDLTEVCDLADRALVLYNGAVFGELARAELSEEAIGFFAMGYRTAPPT